MKPTTIILFLLILDLAILSTLAVNPKCTTLSVSAIDPRMVMDYGDIKGRYIHNPDASVEWAPDRPIYEKVSQSRDDSMHER